MANIVAGGGGERGTTLLAKVLETVKNFITSEVLEEAVTEDWKLKELTKRKTACSTALESWQKLLNDLHKIDRPDQKFFDEGKEKLFMSTTRHEEIKKLKEKIEKYEKALQKALAGDMKDVYELNQQSSNKDKGGGGGKDKDGATESTA